MSLIRTRLYLQSSPRLSINAQVIFRETDQGIHQIFVPSIVLVELIYLAERKRIQNELVVQAFELLKQGSANYRVVVLNTLLLEHLSR